MQEGTITRLGSSDEISLDIRVIAATHRNLIEDVKTGKFREDLFYRLNVVPINMPALRERQEDIPLLVDHFMQYHAKQHKIDVNSLTDSQYRKLLDYHWPGNVRELSNRIERFVLLDDAEELTELPNQLSDNQNGLDQPDVRFPENGYNWELFEQFCLKSALDCNQGNRAKAAKYLGMSYKAFLYRLEKYNIS